MNEFDFKIIKKVKTDNIEFYIDSSIKPNSSYEIENCIKKSINPEELSYQFDFWFDDNDSGYFIKDNIKVEISYGVMDDFVFYISLNHSESEIKKIENWIEKIYICLLEKEKRRLDIKSTASLQSSKKVSLKTFLKKLFK